jgi:hypothetical protein
MEGDCSTDQSPQWAVVPMKEKEEYKFNNYNIQIKQAYLTKPCHSEMEIPA